MSALRLEALRGRGVAFSGWMALLVALVALGAFAWTLELTGGLQRTGLSDYVPWGLYVAAYMFFLGAAAGGLLLASAGDAFEIGWLRPFARIAILVSVVTAALAGLYVFPDLGHPERVWRMFTSPNWSSPLLWDMIAMLALFVVGVLYLGAHLLERERATKAMAYVAMATAVAALLVSASLLGLQASRPMWYSAVMAPLFVASGLVAGLALLLMVALALEWLGIYRFRTESVSRMAGLLAVLVAIEVVLVFTEIVTAIYPGEARDRAAPEALLSGRYAPTFWVEIAACGLLPIVLLAVARLRRRASVVAGASALVLAGIFLMRLNLLMAGFLFPYINLPGGIQVRGLVPGPAEFQMSPTYYPGWVEWLVMFGLMSLGALVLSAALAYWPLQRRLAPRLALKGGAEGETGRYVA